MSEENSPRNVGDPVSIKERIVCHSRRSLLKLLFVPYVAPNFTLEEVLIITKELPMVRRRAPPRLVRAKI